MKQTEQMPVLAKRDEPDTATMQGGATTPESPTGSMNSATDIAEIAPADMAAGGGLSAAASADTHARQSVQPVSENGGTDAGEAVTGELPASENPPAHDDPAFAETLLRAVDERTRRAEKSVLRSMAAQSGVDEEALMQMLAQARAERDAQGEPNAGGEPETHAKPAAGDEAAAPDPRDARADLLGRRLIAAEVRRVGAEMGLVDAEVALSLIGPDALTIGEAGEVEGVHEALFALRARKGYLFGRAGGGAWAQKLDGGGLTPMSGVEEAFYRKNPALRR